MGLCVFNILLVRGSSHSTRLELCLICFALLLQMIYAIVNMPV